MPGQTIECRECGTPFNLDAQWYYDNLCPTCKAEQDGEEVTLPSCVRCQERIPRGEGTTVSVVNPSMRGGTEHVYVHQGKCADEIQSRRGP